MALFNWTKEYSVGVGRMDDDHKKLFNIMNKLYEIQDAGSAQGKVKALLEELIQYTEYHFSEEEKLMEKANYSGLPAQRREHQDLVSKMKDAHAKITANPGMAVFVVADLSMVATDWLKKHILQMDKSYESSLLAAGAV